MTITSISRISNVFYRIDQLPQNLARVNNLLWSFDRSHKSFKSVYSSGCFHCLLLFVYCPSSVPTLILHKRYKMFTDDKIWCPAINYNLQACYIWKQNWKITSATDFMAFLVKALSWWNKSLKLLISGFWATSWQFFSRYREIFESIIYIPNFKSIGPSKQKLQGGGENLPSPRHTNLQKAQSV